MPIIKSRKHYILLVILLFALPYTASVILLLNQNKKLIDSTSAEIQGAEYHREVVEIMLLLHGHTRVNNQKKIEDKSAEIATIAKHYSAFTHTDNPWPVIEDSIAKLLRENSNNYSHYYQTMYQLYEHSNDITNSSNLILDPQLNTYYLMDLMVRAIPQSLLESTHLLVKMHSMLQHAGAGANHGYTNRMVASLRLMEHLRDEFTYAIDIAIQQNPNERDDLTAVKDAVLEAFDNFYTEMSHTPEDRITETSINDVNDTTSLLLSKYHHAYGLASRVLLRLLNQRLQQYENRKIQVIALSSSAFGIFILFFIYAYRVHAKREEIQNAQQMQTILNTVVDGIITIDNRGIIRGFNPAAERIFGYTSQEVFGRNVSMLMPEPDKTAHDLYIKNFLTTGEAKIIGKGREVVVLHKNGRTFPIELAINHFTYRDQKMFVGSVRDISESKQLHEKLRRNEERLSLAWQGAGAGLWDWNMITNEVDFSDRYIAMLGYTRESFPGHVDSWRNLLHPDDVQSISHALSQHMHENVPYDIEYRMLRNNGSWGWFAVRGQAVRDADGKLIRMAGSTNDITKRKEAERRLAEYAQAMEIKNMELDIARDAAQRTTDMKSEFLAMMSHEIRTPMNGILGMIELLLDTPLDSSQQNMAQIVMQSADSLLGIINDILDFSKIEAGKLELEKRPFNLKTCIENLVALLAIRAQEKKIGLHTELNLTNEIFIGDQIRIMQIISNLLSNAIKFTQKGSVTLNVSEEPLDGEETLLNISVTDTGIGIAPEVQEIIFDKFTQADASTTRKFGGTGLGLSICKQLVHMMDGDIGVTSTPNKGSTFWFKIALLNSQQTEQEKASAAVTQTHYTQFDAHILVAEDNEVNQQFIRQLLHKFGCTADIATNGAEALKMMGENSYTLILMDVHMPEMDGFETTRAIRAKEQDTGKHIPIVALTANAMGGDRERCLEAGMDDYMTKPVRQDELATMLNTWIANFHTTYKPKSPNKIMKNDTPALLDKAILNSIRELMEEKFHETVELYITNTESTLSTLVQRVEYMDVEVVRVQAHSLKSASAYMGAQAMQHAAAAMELYCKNNSTDAVTKERLQEHLQTLHTVWQQTKPLFNRD